MTKNQKGFTLFELLVSISVGSVLIMMLMSMMSSILITKNTLDYQNRLGEEVFYINERLKAEFNTLGLRSIEEVFTENTDHYVFLLTHEYDLVLVDGRFVPDITGRFTMVMHLNLIDGALYYGPEEEFNFETISFETPALRRITSENALIASDSSITMVPLKAAQFPYIGATECTLFDDFDCQEKISTAFLEIDINISIVLSSGESLEPRHYFTTLYF